MPEIKSEDKKKFEVFIDEEYINDVLSEYESESEDGEEITLTGDQWIELQELLYERAKSMAFRTSLFFEKDCKIFRITQV